MGLNKLKKITDQGTALKHSNISYLERVAAYKEIERRFKSILNSTSEGYFELSYQGDITYASSSICNITGYSIEELLGKNYRDFTPADHYKKIFKIFNHVYLTRQSADIKDLQFIRDNGETIYFEVSVYLLRNSSGRSTGFHGILRDVTDLRKLEFQLYQAQKMEPIGILASGCAHDFNNLLTTIQGHTSLLLLEMQGNGIPAHYIEKISEIEKILVQAADLNKTLLEVARKGKIEVKTLNINYVVKNIAQMFGRARKEISIIESYSESSLAVDADQGQIEQVLLNIFINSAHAMPGGGDLTIQTESLLISKKAATPYNATPGNYVMISVADTGIGMSEEVREQIFEPFFTTKDKAGGSGLGLASSLNIIKNHNGFISTFSEKDKGTTFNIFLPVSMKKTEKVTVSVEQLDKGNGTILLVDDEEVVARVQAEMLIALGYKVIQALSGSEALSLYKDRQNQIDLIILDMVMPEMSGEETFERLKQINSGSKVLLVSGYNLNGQVKKIMARGCNGFIQKPFSIALLSKKIAEILISPKKQLIQTGIT